PGETVKRPERPSLSMVLRVKAHKIGTPGRATKGPRGTTRGLGKKKLEAQPLKRVTAFHPPAGPLPPASAHPWVVLSSGWKSHPCVFRNSHPAETGTRAE